MASTLRSILVTGANQGLGYHTVHQLGFLERREAFSCLCAPESWLPRAKFASEIDPSSEVVPLPLNVTDSTSIKNAHDFIENYLKDKKLAGLDVLSPICSAGIVGKTFEETYAVNIFGVVAITEAIRPLMNNGGAIVNISSTLGSLHWHTQRPPPPIYPSYNSS
ncbi:hypothetical protein R3P38DRAFT_3515355, partial [Favolaschia claudopus]